MPNRLLLIGDTADKAFRFDALLTTTVADSFSISAIETSSQGICCVGERRQNSAFIGAIADKAFVYSGQFSSTQLTSQTVTGWNGETSPTDLSYDGTDTYVMGGATETIFKISGQFSSTLKTTLPIPFGASTFPTGVSPDGINTAYSCRFNNKCYLLSGQVTSTLNTSFLISGLTSNTAWGLARTWAGGAPADTFYCRIANAKVVRVTGFTSTINDSLSYTARDTAPRGIDVMTHLPWTAVCAGVGLAIATCASIRGTSAVGVGRAIATCVTELLNEVDVVWANRDSSIAQSLLYRTFGQFSSTVLATLGTRNVNTSYFNCAGITVVGADTIWGSQNGATTTGLIRTSGRFSTTVQLTYLAPTAPFNSSSALPFGLAYDGVSDLYAVVAFVGGSTQKIYRFSGAVTSTVHASKDFSASYDSLTGVSWDGENTYFADDNDQKFFLQSGSLSSVLVASFSTTSVDGDARDLAWNGQHTLCTAAIKAKLFKLQGFSSTFVTSQATASAEPRGIDLEDIAPRLSAIPLVRASGVGRAVATCTVLVAYVGTGSGVGKATTSLMAYQIKAALASGVGVATTSCDAGVGQLLSATGVGVGVAIAETSAVRVSVPDVYEILGEAFASCLSATTRGTFKLATGQATGISSMAFTFATAVVKQVTGSGYGFVQAYCDSDVYRSVTQPTSVPNYASSSVVELTVNSQTIDLSTYQYQLDSYRISYDEKTLEFSEIPNSLYSQPSFSPEQDVTLRADWTGIGSLTTYFRGKIKQVVYVGEMQAERIQYTAQGMMQQGNDSYVTFVVSTSVNGTGVVGVTTSTTSVSTSIRGCSVVIRARATVGDGLAALLGSATQTAWSTQLPVDYVSTGSKLQIAQQMASMCGGRIFYDDQINGWHLYNPIDAPIKILNVNSIDLQNHSIKVDTDNTFSALTLIERTTLDHRCFRSVQLREFPLTLVTSYASNLTHYEANASGKQIGTLYRADLPNIVVVDNEIDAIVLALDSSEDEYGSQEQLVDAGGNVSFEKGTLTGLPSYIDTTNPGYEAQHYIDVLTEGDAVSRIIQATTLVPLEPRAYRATAAVVEFDDALTDDFGSNNDACVSPELEQGRNPKLILSWVEYSFPLAQSIGTAGYTGLAYRLYGVQRARIEYVEYGQATGVELARRLRPYAAPLITAELPIAGPPIADLWFLKSRVLLQATTPGATPLQSIPGVLAAYKYQFGKVGSNNLSFSTDLRPYLGSTS